MLTNKYGVTSLNFPINDAWCEEIARKVNTYIPPVTRLSDLKPGDRFTSRSFAYVLMTMLGNHHGNGAFAYNYISDKFELFADNANAVVERLVN